jgi:diadenylate cyclase
MGVADILDILIVAYIIYKAIWFVRRTNSYNVAKGILVILVALLLSYVFDLRMIYFLLSHAVEIGLLALVVLFQPELRRLLERMGRSFSATRTVSTPELETAITETVQACTDMAASKTGALIIFQRSVNLSSIMATGTIVNADVSAELLKNMFFNKAPLHDGAAIIRDARLAAAGCVLPLTTQSNLSKELGMRHRAGIGLSEQSDAVVVIVSEESGSISVALDGMLKRHLSPERLDEVLHQELIRQEVVKTGWQKYGDFVTNLFKGKRNEK